MRNRLEDAYGLKHLFENIFGRKAWNDLKNSTDLNQWKKYSVRLLKAIEVSAQSTVQVVDEQWLVELHDEISFGCDNLETSSDFEQLFANLSASLGVISFLQLGMVPNRLTQKSVTLRHQSNWKLDHYRSVQYVQNEAQRKNSHNKAFKSDS